MRKSPDTLYINGRFLTQPLTGVQRYGRQMLKSLDSHLACPRREHDLRVVLLVPRGARTVALNAIVTRAVGCLAGHWWDQLELPYYSRSGALLSLCGAGPITHRQHLVVIHDAAVFASRGAYTPIYSQSHRMLGRALSKTARGIATVSFFSRSELCRTLHLDAHEVDVIPNGADHITQTPPDPSMLIRLALKPQSYVVALGGNSPNKNVASAVLAVERLSGRLPITLVIVEPQKTRGVFKGVNIYNHPAVKSASNASDAQLRALYEQALCLVFPSIYEGFGIPPLEAMSCGCPVVVSDIPALRETCGSAALYSEPDDHGSFATHMRALATDPLLREEMCERGHDRAKHFTWSSSAKSLMACLSVKLGIDGGV